MAIDDVRTMLVTGRAKPTAVADSVQQAARGGRFGESAVLPFGKSDTFGYAAEGSYFVATNPTPGTAIAGIAGTGAFSDAESLLFIRNTSTAGEGKYIHLDWLELIGVVAGTNGTNHRYVSKIDTGTSRVGTGGSSITAVNVNMYSSETAPATIVFGAVATAAASSSARLIQNGKFKDTILTAGDRYVLDYGGRWGFGRYSVAAAEGTAIATIVEPHVPVVIGPEQMYVLGVHAASQTVASEYEFNLAFVVR